MVRYLTKFISKKLFISGLIVIFAGFFINAYPTMVLNNLYTEYGHVNVIEDVDMRQKIQQELTYHIAYFEKLKATLEPIGTLVVVVGILLVILAIAWKYLD
jgi:uncharacterized membrane protein